MIRLAIKLFPGFIALLILLYEIESGEEASSDLCVEEIENFLLD